MTATAEGSPAATRRSRQKSPAATGIWSLEIGRKSGPDTGSAHPAHTPTLPRVNLLPSSVTYSFAMRRIRRILVAAAVLMLLAFAGVWYLQGGQIAEAESQLARAEADNATVLDRVNALAPIKQMYDQITGEQSLVATTLAAQPQSATVISRLAGAGVAAAGGPGEVEFTRVAIEYRGIPEPGGTVNPCPNPDPFSSDITIGCVTFSGTAATRDQVSAMLTAIASDAFFVGPYVNNSTVTEPTDGQSGGVLFTGTAGISTEALEVALTDEQIAAILTPPAIDEAPDQDAGQAS